MMHCHLEGVAAGRLLLEGAAAGRLLLEGAAAGKLLQYLEHKYCCDSALKCAAQWAPVHYSI